MAEKNPREEKRMLKANTNKERRREAFGEGFAGGPVRSWWPGAWPGACPGARLVARWAGPSVAACGLWIAALAIITLTGGADPALAQSADIDAGLDTATGWGELLVGIAFLCAIAWAALAKRNYTGAVILTIVGAFVFVFIGNMTDGPITNAVGGVISGATGQ